MTIYDTFFAVYTKRGYDSVYDSIGGLYVSTFRLRLYPRRQTIPLGTAVATTKKDCQASVF